MRKNFPYFPFPDSWKDRFSILLFSAITLFVLVFFMAVILPAATAELKFNTFEVENTIDYPASGYNDTLRNIIEDLESQKAFLKARLLSLESDSAVLIINLPDSTVSIQMQGVSVFVSKIHEYKKSRIFSKYPQHELSSWSEVPFTVQNSLASIRKIPLIFKKAPKDTAEAAEQQKNQLISPVKEDTWFRLYTDRYLNISINQVETVNINGAVSRQRFFRKTRKLERRELVNSLTNFKIPEYYSFINIYLSRSDARILYRALPEHAIMVLRL